MARRANVAPPSRWAVDAAARAIPGPPRAGLEPSDRFSLSRPRRRRQDGEGRPVSRLAPRRRSHGHQLRVGRSMAVRARDRGHVPLERPCDWAPTFHLETRRRPSQRQGVGEVSWPATERPDCARRGCGNAGEACHTASDAMASHHTYPGGTPKRIQVAHRCCHRLASLHQGSKRSVAVHECRTEGRSLAEGPYRLATISAMRSPASVGLRPTFTPASSSASIFAAAVPLPPDTMAPAWPIFLPGGAVTPAT